MEHQLLTDYLADLAETMPQAQRLLDAVQQDNLESYLADMGGALAELQQYPALASAIFPPCVRVVSQSFEFTWLMRQIHSQGGQVGISLTGIPINASLAILHSKAVEHAGRIRFEVVQSPVSPAKPLRGESNV